MDICGPIDEELTPSRHHDSTNLATDLIRKAYSSEGLLHLCDDGKPIQVDVSRVG
jgi:hypothetical protein